VQKLCDLWPLRPFKPYKFESVFGSFAATCGWGSFPCLIPEAAFVTIMVMNGRCVERCSLVAGRVCGKI